VAAWREEDHPRDERGRFARKGTFGAVSIKRTLANIEAASFDDLLDVMMRLSRRKDAMRGLTNRQIMTLDRELARREGSTELEAVTDDTPEERQVDAMILRGVDPAEAYAEVYGDKMRVGPNAAQSAVDEDRRKGETREQALRRQYQEVTYLAMLQAEEWTRGHLLTREAEAKGIDPASLFSGRRDRARKYASEELKRFWAEVTPRQTYQEFRAARVGDSAAKGKAKAMSLAGSGRDFGL
jgi:hypothetical protein